MRRYVLLFVLLIIFGGVKGQELDSLQIIEKAKDYFKKIYVEFNFKDPYSYELLKITADKVSLREKLEFDINVFRDAKKSTNMDSISRYSDFFKAKQSLEALTKTLSKGEKLKGKDYDKYLEKYGKYIELYNDRKKTVQDFRDAHVKIDSDLLTRQNMINDKSLDFKRVGQWRISLDCYAANSYGNKILGRYIFRMSTQGKIEGEVIKIN